MDPSSLLSVWIERLPISISSLFGILCYVYGKIKIVGRIDDIGGRNTVGF